MREVLPGITGVLRVWPPYRGSTAEAAGAGDPDVPDGSAGDGDSVL